MPSANINEVLASKPLTFSIKTSGGSWKCQLHSNRASYEKTRSTAPTGTVAPGISRSDSGLSTSSSSSAGSSSSH
ncbi:hypothetical protein F5Y08DRAFT_343292 [Xylaria arbuscula]|nr:hypothetical protein F5Y08DRAFT_343292 [Xylaria arbuscula]